jgi:flagellin
MALSILNNIASIAAQNQLAVTSKSLNTALFQLSSGSRINSGADDAAGLAIADGLHANITALTQSARNANDGVGELQVADGSLAQVTTLLNRSVTLATEAATGTVSDAQRVALNAEFTAIKAEIDRVGSKTNYNGGQVFTANTLNIFLSDAGATSNSTIGVTTGTLSSTDLSLGGAVAATGTLTQAAGAAAVASSDTLTPGGSFTAATIASEAYTTSGLIGDGYVVTIGSQTYTFQTAALTGASAAGAVFIGASGNTSALQNLKDAINGAPGLAGTEYATGTVANTAATAADLVAGTSLTITANINGLGAAGGGGTGNFTTTTVASSANATFVGATLNSGTPGVAGSTVTVGGQTYTFVTSLSSKPTANEVVGTVQAAQLIALSEAVNAGPNAGTAYSASTTQNAKVSAATAAPGLTGTTLKFTALVAGFAGNGINGTTSVGSFTAFAFSGGSDTGAAPVAAAGDTVVVGGTTYTFVAALNTTPLANEILVGLTEAASLANLANAVNGGTGSGATYGSPTVANTSATATAAATTVTFTAITKGLAGNSTTTTATGGHNTFGAADLAGGTAGSVNDLLNITDATAALATINSAIQTVAGLRGTIGAAVNRLQSAAGVITNQVQNLTGAEDGIRAADIPSTVASLAKFSILEQTGISALAQANQQQQLVLKLLQ